MPALATGIDLIEIERFQNALDRHQTRLLKRIFTARELDEVGDKVLSLAGRFAAKEAVTKALECGIGPVEWHEIEILRGPSGQPVLVLSGKADQLAKEKGLLHWSVSLSHTQVYAAAVAVASGN